MNNQKLNYSSLMSPNFSETTLRSSKKAFTLVELIIVIVILAILATISFITFSSYSASARDSTRLSDMTNITAGLEMFQIKVGTYPLPEGVISTGTIDGVELVYKGVIGERLSKMLNLSKTITDPLDSNTYYLYGITYNKTKFQLAITTEENATVYNISDTLVNKAYASSNNQARVKGNYMGVIKFSTGSNSNMKHYIANVPSLLYNFNGTVTGSGVDLINDKSKVFFIVDKKSNLPYLIQKDVVLNNITTDELIQDISINSSATLTGVDITSIINEKDEEKKEEEITKIFGTGGDLSEDESKVLLASFGITGAFNTQAINSIISNNGGGSSSTTVSSSSPTQTEPEASKDCIAVVDYNGYSIPAISNADSREVTKTETVTNGTFTYSLPVSCSNTELTYGTETKILTCTSPYIPDNNTSCIEDKCKGTNPPANSDSSPTQSYSSSWTYSETPGTCTWKCAIGYEYDTNTNTCKPKSCTLPYGGTMTDGQAGIFGYDVSSATSPDTCDSHKAEFVCSLGNISPSGYINESCTNLAPTCTSFTYTPTQVCQLDGTQTVSIATRSPAGCTGGLPLTSQSCTYIPPFTCGISTVTEGGEIYTTKLGPDGKCWTSQNMRHGTMLANGATMPSSDTTIEKWCYNNTTSNCTNNGGLYTWAEALQIDPSYNTITYTPPTNIKGICPDDWHIPSDSEWTAVINVGATGWLGNRLSGIISVLPGYRGADGSFSFQGSMGFWWFPSQFSSVVSYFRYLYSGDAVIYRDNYNKAYGFSVICIKNY